MNADWEKTVLVFMTTALARSFRAKITEEVPRILVKQPGIQTHWFK